MSDFCAREDEDEFLDAVEGPLSDQDEIAGDTLQEVQESPSQQGPSGSSTEHLKSCDDERSVENGNHDETDDVDDGHERDIDEALKAKEDGNNFFREKDYERANEMYSRAIYMCPLDDDHAEQMAVFYGNRSACYSATLEFDLVVADCSNALKLNENYLKVLMRRCQAYESLEKYDDAISGN